LKRILVRSGFSLKVQSLFYARPHFAILKSVVFSLNNIDGLLSDFYKLFCIFLFQKCSQFVIYFKQLNYSPNLLAVHKCTANWGD